MATTVTEPPVRSVPRVLDIPEAKFLERFPSWVLTWGFLLILAIALDRFIAVRLTAALRLRRTRHV